MTQMHQYKLPQLPYDLGALEPTISREIMDLHYNKHHLAYITNLNKALEELAQAESSGDLAKEIALQSAIRFNGGGHLNHSLFWENLAPKDQGGGIPPQGVLATAIDRHFGSLQNFIEKFNTVTVAIQGSGWGWLVYHRADKRLDIVTYQNQDPVTGYTPLLGIDVWEHSYYLQYKNARLNYLKAIWDVINWKTVIKRYEDAIR